jgi:hypothetical protein
MMDENLDQLGTQNKKKMGINEATEAGLSIWDNETHTIHSKIAMDALHGYAEGCIACAINASSGRKEDVEPIDGGEEEGDAVPTDDMPPECDASSADVDLFGRRADHDKIQYIPSNTLCSTLE